MPELQLLLALDSDGDPGDLLVVAATLPHLGAVALQGPKDGPPPARLPGAGTGPGDP